MIQVSYIMPTYGEYTGSTRRCADRPSGLSTHHLVYPVYTPVRHDITITYIYICYGPICNPAPFEAGQPASKQDSQLHDCSKIMAIIILKTGWLDGFETGWVDTNAEVTGQHIHRSADGLNSWLQNQWTVSSLANLFTDRSNSWLRNRLGGHPASKLAGWTPTRYWPTSKLANVCADHSNN